MGGRERERASWSELERVGERKIERERENGATKGDRVRGGEAKAKSSSPVTVDSR